MNKKKLKIKLLPDGSIEMTTEGIKGKKCVDYIKLLETLTDSKVKKQEFTPEYYEEEYEYIQQEQQVYNWEN